MIAPHRGDPIGPEFASSSPQASPAGEGPLPMQRIPWAGVGRVVFPAMVEPRDAEDAPTEDESGDPPEFACDARSLREYLTAGGTQAMSLVVGRGSAGVSSRGNSSQGESGLWSEAELLHQLGVDEGPGARSGLSALAELDDVGAVVVPPLAPGCLSRLLPCALAQPAVFWFVEQVERELGPGEASWSRPIDNVLLLSRGADMQESDPAATDSAESRVPSAAGLAGWLETVDHVPKRLPSAVGSRSMRGSSLDLPGQRAERTLPPTALLRDLHADRIWSALVRSIDRGTRWVAFEPLTPGFERRVERQIESFFHDLSFDGVLVERGPQAWSVRAEALADQDAVRLWISVCARLAPRLCGSASRQTELCRSLISSPAVS